MQQQFKIHPLHALLAALIGGYIAFRIFGDSAVGAEPRESAARDEKPAPGSRSPESDHFEMDQVIPPRGKSAAPPASDLPADHTPSAESPPASEEPPAAPPAE